MKAFFIACGVSLAALGLSTAAVLNTDGGLPGWARSAGLLVMLAASLAYGFFAALPSLAPLLMSRSMRGTAFVLLGIAGVWLPPQFAIAALLIGAGTRLIWTAAACDLADAGELADAAIVTPSTGVMPSPSRRGVARQEWEIHR